MHMNTLSLSLSALLLAIVMPLSMAPVIPRNPWSVPQTYRFSRCVRPSPPVGSAEVGRLSVDLASKIVGKELDRSTHQALVDDYIQNLSRSN